MFKMKKKRIQKWKKKLKYTFNVAKQTRKKREINAEFFVSLLFTVSLLSEIFKTLATLLNIKSEMYAQHTDQRYHSIF